jgi:Tol biopolymer transport system component
MKPKLTLVLNTLVFAICSINNNIINKDTSSCLLSYRTNTSQVQYFLDIEKKTLSEKPILYLFSPVGNEYLTNEASILVLHSVTGQFSPITLNPSGFYADTPSWSPDGNHIVFVAFQTNINLEITSDIYIANAHGTGIQNLSKFGKTNELPVWSPDSTHIAFYSDHFLNHPIWTVAPNGSQLRSYEEKSVENLSTPPLWSPDSRYLAIQAAPNRIDVIDTLNGWTSIVVSGENILRIKPTWSPDSHWIAYIEGGHVEGPLNLTPHKVTMKLIKVSLDGSIHFQITPDSLSISEAQWSPDSEQIAVVSQGVLYVINSDGSSFQEVKRLDDGVIYSVNWVCEDIEF